MGYYVRMLSKGKWEAVKEVSNTPADTLQSELKTTGNTLSLWHIDNLEDLNEAVIALASARNSIDRIDVICIEENLLSQFKVDNSPNTGLSPYQQFNERHYDIREVDYKTIGLISEIILKNLASSTRISRGEVLNLLVNSYKEGKLKEEFLEDNLKEKLTTAIA